MLYLKISSVSISFFLRNKKQEQSFSALTSVRRFDAMTQRRFDAVTSKNPSKKLGSSQNPDGRGWLISSQKEAGNFKKRR